MMPIFLCECIVALGALALFALIPITPVLLAAYTCNQLASLEFMVAAILASGDRAASPQSRALPSFSFKFLLVSMMLSAAAVAVEALGIAAVPLAALLVPHGLLQVFYLAKAVVVSSGASYVSKVGDRAAAQLATFDTFLAEAKQCSLMVSDDGQRRQLKKVCEAIQFSDPVGCAATADDERKIHALLDELKRIVSGGAPESSELEDACRRLTQAIQSRNDNLRIHKMRGASR